jgi:hypothetical protein
MPLATWPASPEINELNRMNRPPRVVMMPMTPQTIMMIEAIRKISALDYLEEEGIGEPSFSLFVSPLRVCRALILRN